MTKYLTSDGLEKLKKELENLERVERKKIAEKMKLAVSFGDLSENAAYDEARESQSFLENRISELKGVIYSAKIVENNQARDVQVGSIVLLSKGNEKEKFEIVGPEEADVFGGKISYQSPLGKVLLGKTKGSRVNIKTPEGKIEYKIFEIK